MTIAASDSRIVTTLDLDGDGWADAVGWWRAWWDANRMRCWINDGTGRLVDPGWTLAFPWSDAAIEPHDATASGDLDGDGDDDFVVSNGDELRVWTSNGAAAPTSAIVHAGPALGSVTLADFDLDGTLELALIAASRVEIHEIDLGNGVLSLVSSDASGVAASDRLVAAELTGDRTPDLLVAGHRILPVVAGQIGAPILHPPAWAPEAGVSLRHDVGDVDGDGDLDAVTFRVAPETSGQPAQYRVLRRTGPASFAAEPAKLGGPARRLVDVDGDGDLDGVCCGSGGPPPPGNSALSKFRLSWNDGTGRFAPSVTVPGLGSTAIAGVEDLDHDGDLDLVAGRCVLYAANGPITGSPLAPAGTRLQDERTICDPDGDGDPDVELVLEGGAASVHANLGDGSQDSRAVPLPPEMPGLARVGDGAPGDWDGDGDVDLLATLGTQAAPLGLELLRNVGCGAFLSAGVVAEGAQLAGYPLAPEDSLAADVDGDGDLDLVRRTRSAYGSVVSLQSAWWRNEGAQGFVFVNEFKTYGSAGGRQIALEVADFDGDDVPDVLASTASMTEGIYELRLAKGLGGGTFGTFLGLSFGVGTRPDPPGDQVCAVDVDGDGDLDVALARVYGAGAVAGLYLNQGNGTFVAAAGFPNIDLELVLAQPCAAAVADVDDDGRLDLVYGPVKDARSLAGILLRRADDSGYEPPIFQAIFSEVPGTGQWSSWLTPCDPDGDGDPDLLTHVRVENLRHAPPEGGSRLQMQDGIAGSGEIVPTLGAVGPFRVGVQGELRLRGARPGAPGVLVARYASSPPAPFGALASASHRIASIEPFVTSGAPGGAAGGGAWSEAILVPAVDAGRTKLYEARVQDPAAAGGTARSNTLVLVFGP